MAGEVRTMGILITEASEILPVPYGFPHSEGSPPETGFVDLKAHPEWTGVLPSCLGWPETRDLLRIINAPASPLMTVASAQGFCSGEEKGAPVVLASFVTLCYADRARNSRAALMSLADGLREGLDAALQAAATKLQRTLDLQVVLELQPTLFRPEGVRGCSLTAWLAVPGGEAHEARETWRVAVRALAEVVAALESGPDSDVE